MIPCLIFFLDTQLLSIGVEFAPCQKHNQGGKRECIPLFFFSEFVR